MEPVEESTRTTQLLNRLSAGDSSVSAELVERIHTELHGLARAHMARESPSHTLQPTALVNEAWMRLVRAEDASWKSRNHFYSMASKVMRSLLVDHARERRAKKRGGDRVRVPLDAGTPTPDAAAPDVDLIDLHEALEALGDVDPDLVDAVELRFFGGLTVPEMATALDTSTRTVERRLKLANAWLRRRIEG